MRLLTDQELLVQLNEATIHQLMQVSGGGVDVDAREQVILDYIRIAAPTLSKRPDFLTAANVMALLTGEGVNLNEDELLDVVMQWWCGHPCAPDAQVESLLDLIKGPYLTPACVERHADRLEPARVSAWQAEQRTTLAYRVNKNNPLRQETAYQPREFEKVCQRWMRMVHSQGLLPDLARPRLPVGLFRRYIGSWSSGPYRQNQFAYSFVLELEAKEEDEHQGVVTVHGRLQWRLEHFHAQENSFYLELARRYRHQEDEIVEGTYHRHKNLLTLTGTEIRPYPTKESYCTDVIGLDSYRVRVLNSGQVLSGVTKGNEEGWDNQFDAVWF